MKRKVLTLIGGVVLLVGCGTRFVHHREWKMIDGIEHLCTWNEVKEPGEETEIHDLKCTSIYDIEGVNIPAPSSSTTSTTEYGYP